jgi:hypothetical protein
LTSDPESSEEESREIEATAAGNRAGILKVAPLESPRQMGANEPPTSEFRNIAGGQRRVTFAPETQKSQNRETAQKVLRSTDEPTSSDAWSEAPSPPSEGGNTPPIYPSSLGELVMRAGSSEAGTKKFATQDSELRGSVRPGAPRTPKNMGPGIPGSPAQEEQD